MYSIPTENFLSDVARHGSVLGPTFLISYARVTLQRAHMSHHVTLKKNHGLFSPSKLLHRCLQASTSFVPMQWLFFCCLCLLGHGLQDPYPQPRLSIHSLNPAHSSPRVSMRQRERYFRTGKAKTLHLNHLLQFYSLGRRCRPLGKIFNKPNGGVCSHAMRYSLASLVAAPVFSCMLRQSPYSSLLRKLTRRH